MIRIIAGKYKGRFLKVPTSKNTRPTMDKVRQAIFSALKGKSENATCLDLFSGSGSMGIEALSRGAKKCYFIDRDHQTFKTLRENVLSLGESPDHYELYCQDYRLFLKRNKEIRYDLVFLDPPYRFTINKDIIEYLRDNDRLEKNAIIVSEQDYENDEIVGFERKEYRYGQKHVALYQRKEEV